MKKLIRAADTVKTHPAGDWVEDGMFRNYTPEKVAERIKTGCDLATVKSDLTSWIKRETQYGNDVDASFGQSVLDILINDSVV